jgi:hypothetical protein
MRLGVFISSQIVLAQIPTMPPTTQAHREPDIDLTARLAQIEQHLTNQDTRLDDYDAKLDSILIGLSGTIEKKGLAGRVRDLEDWRQRVDAVLNRLIWYVVAPVSMTLLISVLGFLWALWTNKIDIVIR